MSNRPPAKFVRYQLLGIIIAIGLNLMLMVLPVRAIDRADIVVDGRPLFKVSGAESLTASERADLLNLRLQQIQQSAKPIEVSIESRNQSPIILINDRQLLTVTQSDVVPPLTPTTQANLWAQQLSQALQQAQQEKGTGFLKTAIPLALGTLAVAIALHYVLGWLWRSTRSVLQRLVESSPTAASVETESPKALSLLSTLTLIGARIALWMGTMLYITNLFPLTRSWSYALTSGLTASFLSPIVSVGKNRYSVTDLLLLSGLLLGWIVLSGVAANFLKLRILQVTRIGTGSQDAVAAIVKYLLIILGTIAILQVWGIDLTSLTILFSALGVGIGFGFQDIAKNFGSGLILLFERPIQVGDFVNVGNLEGTVVRIGARSTVLRTLDRVSIIVPNSRFLEKEVINWNYENPLSRVRIPVGVAYGCDISAVKTALLKAPQGHPEVLATPAPIVFFLGFGDSSLNFELRVWINEPMNQYRIKSDLFFRIEELFREHQIEIPFPQRDLHLRSGSLPLVLSPELESFLGKDSSPS